MAKPARTLPQFHELPPVRSGAQSKPQPVAKVVTVGAKALARHLDLTHPRILQLRTDGVLEHLPNSDKFDLDKARVAYIRWLRDPERRTAKSKVDSDFVRAKTELIAIRVREKKRDLIEFSEAMELAEKLIGTTLTALSGMAPRVARLVEGNSALVIRREVDRIVFDTRTNLANQFNEFAAQAEAEQPKQAPITDSTDDD